MPRLDFVPSRDGFHFANHFANHIGPFTSYGRCGGMTYAALDYYLNRRPVPTHAEGDFGDQLAPHDGSRLADYILRRQVASLANAGAAKFLTWQGFWTSARDRVERTSRHEFPDLRHRIDAGHLTPLGLVSAGGLTDSHQVLAYGYEVIDGAGVAVIYDNNRPDVECVLRPNHALDAIEEFDRSEDPTLTGRPFETWRGWFVHDDYDLSRPPLPDYQDFELTGQAVVDGTALRFAVLNVGEYDAHVQAFGADVRREDGVPFGAGVGAAVTSGPVRLTPGAGHQSRAELPVGLGEVRVAPAMQTDQGHWLDVTGPARSPLPGRVPFLSN